MAIARDTFTSITGSTSGATSITKSYTTTGSNTCALAFVREDNGDTVTGVTYGGSAMTLLCKHRNGFSGTGEIYLYGILAPTAGAQSVVATRTGTTGKMWMGVMSYTGVKQTGLPDAIDLGGLNSNPSLSFNVITTTTNTVIAGICWMDNGGITASTNSTAVGAAADSNTVNFFESASVPIAASGSYTMSITGSTGSNCSWCFASLAPAGGGGGGGGGAPVSGTFFLVR